MIESQLVMHVTLACFKARCQIGGSRPRLKNEQGYHIGESTAVPG